MTQTDSVFPELGERYQLLSNVAQSPSDAVYVARDQLLERQVIVKVFRVKDDVSRKQAAKIVRQARSSMNLNHPAVVTIYDAAIDGDGHPAYIVMECCRDAARPSGNVPLARPLPDQIRDRRVLFSTIEAIEIILDVCDAIATAHAQGLVHHELTPERVLIFLEGGSFRAKVLGPFITVDIPSVRTDSIRRDADACRNMLRLCLAEWGQRFEGREQSLYDSLNRMPRRLRRIALDVHSSPSDLHHRLQEYLKRFNKDRIQLLLRTRTRLFVASVLSLLIWPILGFVVAPIYNNLDNLDQKFMATVVGVPMFGITVFVGVQASLCLVRTGAGKALVILGGIASAAPCFGWCISGAIWLLTIPQVRKLERSALRM